MIIKTSKSDYVWSYVGTFFRLGSSFLLLPFILSFLSDAEMGLWYVFLAVNSFVTLFQAGFVPAFARNIAYCMSGAREVAKEGVSKARGEGIDYALFQSLVSASRVVYRAIALAGLAGILTLGSLYVTSVASGVPEGEYLPAWFVFCIAMFLNLYFSYYESLLRGIGDLSSTNKSVVVSSLMQLVVSATLLITGLGLSACALAFCAQGLAFRVLCRRFFFRHPAVSGKINERKGGLSDPAVRSIIAAIAPNAIRDTIVSLANYAVTTANTIICSMTLSIEATGPYSIILQLVNAAAGIAVVPLSTNQPALQSAAARGDRETERALSGLTVALFVAVFFACMLGVAVVVVPVIKVLRPAMEWDWLLFVLVAAYIFLWRQHSMCATFITNANVLPFTRAFVVSGLLGIILTLALCRVCGVYGLALGQGLAQACYDNWKWPREAASRLGITYRELLMLGSHRLLELVSNIFESFTHQRERSGRL